MKFLGMNIGADGGTLKKGKNGARAKELMEFRAPVEPVLDESFVQEVQGVRKEVSAMKRFTKQFARAYAAIRIDQAEIAATLAALVKVVKKADLIEQRAANSVVRDEQQFNNKSLQETTRHNNSMAQINQSHNEAMGKLNGSQTSGQIGQGQTQAVKQQPQKRRTLFGGLFW